MMRKRQGLPSPDSSRTGTTPSGGLHLAALSSTLTTMRSSSPARPAGDGERLKGALEATSRRAHSHCRYGCLDAVGQVDGLRGLAADLLTGQLDQFGGERGQVDDLRLQVAEQLLPLRGRHTVHESRRCSTLSRSSTSVRMLGQRGAQRAACVLDESALRLPAGADSGQHRVDRFA
jgi:hypothetical protein